MIRAYLDTSAIGKLLIEEAESDALAAWADDNDAALLGTFLLETELRRVAVRHGIHQAAATAVLEHVSLFDVPPSLYREAGLLPGRHLRSLDALHIASAIRLEADILVTYDVRLADAANDAGLIVTAPANSEPHPD
ncbi:type II toxin-antitoxin system VapC family toxin [Microbacterium sp. X-17]|uniref:type II toxin-antitoxin system VapC family toxin n=1 Tax=Microbacterium sp. X-17 TaxID=3144404 RepID=UPI0031F5AFAE